MYLNSAVCPGLRLRVVSEILQCARRRGQVSLAAPTQILFLASRSQINRRVCRVKIWFALKDSAVEV
jgi:hypothetical protein